MGFRPKIKGGAFPVGTLKFNFPFIFMIFVKSGNEDNVAISNYMTGCVLMSITDNKDIGNTKNIYLSY